MNSSIMAHAQFTRFYEGLRKVEATKTRDGKLAKDTGGASKPKQKGKEKVCYFYLFSFLRI